MRRSRQSRPRLLRLGYRLCRRIHRPPILHIDGCRLRFRNVRLVLNERTFALAHKRQRIVIAVPIDAHEVAEMHLFGRQQIRQRINHVLSIARFKCRAPYR